jgi:hypothetical protein
MRSAPRFSLPSLLSRVPRSRVDKTPSFSLLGRYRRNHDRRHDHLGLSDADGGTRLPENIDSPVRDGAGGPRRVVFYIRFSERESDHESQGRDVLLVDDFNVEYPRHRPRRYSDQTGRSWRFKSQPIHLILRPRCVHDPLHPVHLAKVTKRRRPGADCLSPTYLVTALRCWRFGAAARPVLTL